MIKLLKYLKSKDWIFIFISLLFIVCQVWLDLKLPDYMSDITALIQTPNAEMIEIWKAGGKMLVCALGSLIASVIVGYFISGIAAGLSKTLRSNIFRKVESFSMHEINQFSVPSLITRSTNDITQVQMIIAMGLQVLIKAPITAVWALGKISSTSWQWTTATAVAVVALLIVVSGSFLLALPKFKIIQTLTDNLNKVARENLTGIRVVRAYNAEKYQEDKFEKANDEITKTNLFTGRVMGVLMPFIQIIMSGLSLSIYWIGAYLINEVAINSMEDIQNRITVFSDMVVFSSYAIQVVIAFMMLVIVFIMMPRAQVAANRINEVLNTPLTIINGTRTSDEEEHVGEVEFRNVYFKYPDAENSTDYVLENISFKANKGETIAFIGATGSGKSTLINLIPRFYDVTSGEVLVNGVNVKDYDKNYLTNKIGYVSQRTVMFSGTVESNVSYGDNGKEKLGIDAVKRAVEIAQGKEFVEKLEKQYESEVAQGGTNLSGGQKQRLSIARAIHRDPEIYIFDDSFSALDYRTDKVLRAALNKETKGKTKIIVAQRIGTIKDADKIIVLDEGKIVGIGKHKELLKTCEVYKEIAYSQLSKEELENE
ncbi:ABC transporter ATP-binding protein [Caproiciproducens sp. MSJ-32]|uniref:ABC transporter ATP-binding protein n=1 Tax=Caproiciproducens sp. MSJ-32 TaxID=2841527 RepID=UPI001C106140|nr:ABC transporter ATP-binding protein [Caproiciproducens sp. MSJ-32]MBU5455527.1 ABC transporter ATP-binding protein/permease [Caproiciproducens sp. MSJ-32]